MRSPYDGSEVGQVPRCSAADVDKSVAAALAAHEAGPLPPWRRAEILDAAARLLADRIEEFARTIAAESAKPLETARAEAKRAVSTFTFAAVEARRLTGDMVPIDAAEVGEGRVAFTLRVPVGVVGAISPFNFPLNLVAHKLAPAIAAGCPVVLKPASQTPLTAVALARLLVDDCGLPADHLHVVTGSGGEVGDALVRHPDVAYLTFTGSGEVGWAIKGKAGRKKVALELGNNSPVIVEADGDWEAAAKAVAATGFAHAGQSCVSVQRVLVHQAVAEAFTDRLAGLVEELVVGDPLDEDTDVSALISPSERDRVKEWIDEAVAGGAKVRTGGTIVDEGILGPPCSPASPRTCGCAGTRCSGRSWPCSPTPPPTRASAWPTTAAMASRPGSTRPGWTPPCGPPAACISERCWSTRCRRGGPTRCPTAGYERAATPRKARHRRCGR